MPTINRYARDFAASSLAASGGCDPVHGAGEVLRTGSHVGEGGRR